MRNQVARLSGGAIEIASAPVAGAKVRATSAAK
jgi:hypothetical protein